MCVVNPGNHKSLGTSWDMLGTGCISSRNFPRWTFLQAHVHQIIVSLHSFFCTVLSAFFSDPRNLLSFTSIVHGEKLRSFIAYWYITPSTAIIKWSDSFFFFFFRHSTWYFTWRLVNIQASFRQLWSFCIGNEHLILRSHETMHPYRRNMFFKKILCPLL